jgi:hypothetical protein
MARTTYASRIAPNKAELTPTLSLGISINHAVSMTVPTLGGIVWDMGPAGYRCVFLGAGIVAALTLGATSLIPERGPADHERLRAESPSAEARRIAGEVRGPIRGRD